MHKCNIHTHTHMKIDTHAIIDASTVSATVVL